MLTQNALAINNHRAEFPSREGFLAVPNAGVRVKYRAWRGQLDYSSDDGKDGNQRNAADCS
jgi:hypothetical protein